MYARHLLESSIVNFQTNQQQQQVVEFLNTVDDSLVEILFDVKDFSNFVHLNKLGFAKILKKHKKWTMINHEGEPCFEYQSIDSELGFNWVAALYTQVSLLRYQCQQKVSISKSNERNSTLDLKNVIPTTATERKVKKYWILPQHVSEVIAIISMHSSVAQPPSKNSSSRSSEKREKFDFAMSNVYFENNAFDVYSGRVTGRENTQSVKCKRYGSDSNDHIYFDYEEYNKPYSQEISSKKKCRVEYKQLIAFYKGEYKISSEGTATSPSEDIDEKEALKLSDERATVSNLFAAETQNMITSSDFAPVIQCDYQRLSFQSPLGQYCYPSLSITIDTDISFSTLKGDSLQESIFLPDENEANNQELFQYAVLEIKFPADSKFDDSSLEWFRSFTQNSNLIHEVPKFSKYLQGVYQLFFSKNQTLQLPEWDKLYQQGISSFTRGSYGLSRSRSLRPLLNGKPFRSVIPYSAAGSINNKRSIRKSLQHHPKQLSQKETEDHTQKRECKPSYRSDSVSSDFTAISIDNHFTNDGGKLNGFRDSKMVLDMDEKPEIKCHQPVKEPKSSIKFFFSRQKNEDGNPIQYSNQQQKKGKKKDEVIKIEPKAFFANERTFISWLQFCALLLTVALNLLNFGDQVSKVCGGIFLFISMMLALYALFRFQYRAWQLRHPNQTGRYDDLYGPAILCILVVAALVINFGLRFKYITNQESQDLYPPST
ncbi:unnamed protein product [Mucor hiemalis]